MNFEIRTYAVKELGRHHNMETSKKYFYLNNDGTMHVSDYEDDAYKFGKGPRAVAEGIPEDRGYPLVKGKSIIIEGIAENGDLKVKEGTYHTTTKVDCTEKVWLKEIYEALEKAGYTK